MSYLLAVESDFLAQTRKTVGCTLWDINERKEEKETNCAQKRHRNSDVSISIGTIVSYLNVVITHMDTRHTWIPGTHGYQTHMDTRHTW